MNASLRQSAVNSVRVSLAAQGAEVAQACADALKACEAAGLSMLQVGLEIFERERADYRAELLGLKGGAR